MLLIKFIYCKLTRKKSNYSNLKYIASQNELYSKVLMSEPNVHSDFSRLARWLTGTSVGLVLGGGGARGAAHVGMLKAIIEAGIPIDMVGGVSIGAFMGALWCMEKNITTTTQKAREWSKVRQNRSRDSRRRTLDSSLLICKV